MFIKKLIELYERLAADGLVAKEGKTEVKISGRIILNENGEIMDIRFPEKKEVERVLVPYQATRSNGKKPFFLCDNAKYMLGITEDPGYFVSARTLHMRLLSGLKDPAAKALYLFFEKNEAGKPLPVSIRNDEAKMKKLGKTSSLIFVYEGKYILFQPEIEQAAEDLFQEREGEHCLDTITGEPGIFAPVHQKIKGVPGAKATGSSLISFKQPSFQKFGRKNGENVLITEHSQFAYTTALNYLLREKEHHFNFKNGSIVFWSEKKEMSSFVSEVIGGFSNEEEPMYQIMNDLLHGKMPKDPLPERYYIAGLRGNAGRVSLTFFYENSLNGLMKNVEDHLLQMKLQEGKRIPSIGAVLLEAERPGVKFSELNEAQIEAFLNSILHGWKYPEPVYRQILNRIIIENAVNYRKSAFIKACLMKNYEIKEEHMNKEKAYQAGVLFSYLEQMQEEAARLSDTPLGRSIRDRYFGAAMVRPGSVFPTLLRLSVHHKAKLFRAAAGYATNLDTDITNLVTDIGPMPLQFSVEEQGLFALGYYTARQKRFEKKEKEDKEENK